jgi:selenocysteine lyase/cysteine desulfurase
MSFSSDIELSEPSLLANQRDLFEIPDDIAYLNCAYVSPLLKHSADAIRKGVSVEQQPWKISADDFYDPPDRARKLFASLIGATVDDIAIVPSASYGVATAAVNIGLTRGQNIVVLSNQHPSNLYPWRRCTAALEAILKTIHQPEDGDWTTAILDAIDAQTAAVALPNNHWMDGSLIDLVRIGEATRSVGAAFVVDVSQSLGAMPLDIGAVQPDFLVAAGYKWMLCPYSISFLYVAPHRQNGTPIEESPNNRANSRDFARMAEYRDDFEPGARRFDVGERANFILLPGAIAALEQLIAWNPASIQHTLGRTNMQIAERASELGLTSQSPTFRAGHFLGLSFPKGVPDGLLQTLAEKKIYVSVRGDSLRITPHLWVTDNDIERFFDALEKAL